MQNSSICTPLLRPHQFIYVYVNDKFSKPDKSFSLSNLLSLLGRLLGFICTSSQLSVTDGGEVFERHKSMNFSLQCASQDIFTLMGHVLPTSLRFKKGKKSLITSCSQFVLGISLFHQGQTCNIRSTVQSLLWPHLFWAIMRMTLE